jgi:hypothetical protein
MRRPRLTTAEVQLLHHALEITASDYDPANGVRGDGTPEPYRVKMQKRIEKLKEKLHKIQEYQNETK